MTGASPLPSTSHDDIEDAGETAILTIDLGALAANYRRLRELAAPAECAAVVKADAYGLGMAEAAPALWRQGCRTFFVATPDEAYALRKLLPQAIIYVLAGLMPGTAEMFRKLDLRPVLNSAEEIREWASYSASVGEALPCAVHIDSGMNRLGLSAAEVDSIAAARDLWSAFTLSLVMSHLACADEPEHPKSETQRKLFDGSVRVYQGPLRASPTPPASFSAAPILMIWCGRASPSMAGSPRPVGPMSSPPSSISRAASFRCATSPPVRRSATARREL